MKRILLLTLVSFSWLSNAQNVTIPDANFKAYLVGNGAINTNSDTEIQVTEAQAYTGVIHCYNLSIADLTGLEAFTGITDLRCYLNQLTSLDVSQNTALTYLDCGANNLTSIQVSTNNALEHLSCSDNELTSIILPASTVLTTFYCGINPLTNIDVSANTGLQYFECTENLLTSLDVSQNTNLILLNCHFNQITSLDLSTNVALEQLNCRNNQITSLDVSNCPLLNLCNCGYNQLGNNLVLTNGIVDLRCEFNQMTSLDVSGLSNLEILYCYNNELTSLNVANGNNTIITSFIVSNNPDLTCIEVDDVAYSDANWTMIDANSSFSTDCQFTSVSENSFTTIRIHPNPTENLVFFDQVILSAKVIDLSGKIVLTSVGQFSKIDLSELEKGTYLIHLIGERGLYTERIFKK